MEYELLATEHICEAVPKAATYLMDFFTEDDIRLLGEYGGQVHRGTLKAQEVERKLSEGVWAKTKEWANLLASDEFEAVCRRSVVKQAGSLPKQADGRRRMRRVFRPYSWAKLFRPGTETHGIFFTVGVEGESQELVWKLDCMRDGSKGLDQRLVSRFDEYIERNAPKAAWRSAKLTDSKAKNWNNLLATTRRFVQEYAHHYDAAVKYTWQGEQPGRNKLARLCWNTIGWQRPSGPIGKSTGPGTHENSEEAGFGAEEWLLNFERVVNGYQYGFLKQLNNDANTGRDLNIRLFTKDAASNTHYYVGRILDAHVLTEEDREEISQLYRQRGWYNAMQEELDAIGGVGTVDSGDDSFAPFNIRFKPTDVNRPVGGLEVIEDINEWTGSQRYKLFQDRGNYREDNEKRKKVKAKVVFAGKTGGKNSLPGRRRIESQQIELVGLHNRVQDKLLELLTQQHPKQHIEVEACIEPYGTKIDIVRVRSDGGHVFYEVKVLSTVRACIREALGQLLEYAHWSDNDLSREWVIVSYHVATQEVLEYMEKLGSTYGLPISYQQVELID